jgi:arylsulfatase A-like enzyme
VLPRESARALGAGAFGVLGAAIGEWVLATPRPGLLVFHLLGIDALLFIPLAALAAVVAPGAAEAWRRAQSDRRAGPWLLASLAGAFVAAAGLFAVSLVIQSRAANRTLAAIAVAAGSLVAAAVGAFAAAASRRLLARLGLDLQRSLGVAAGVLCASAAAGAVVLRGAIAEMDSALLHAPLGAIAFSFVGGIVVRRGAIAGPLALGFVLSFAIPLLALEGDPASRRALEPGCPFASTLLRVEARPLDRDRDGYAWLLGGGDCDDANRHVYPGAREVPMDRVDQDCDGRDLELPPPAPRPPPAPPVAPARIVPDRPLSVLLVTIDTLRADHVGAYGYRRATTPNLDALAAQGTRFEWAYAQGPNTKSSIPSVLSGLYFSELRRTDDLWADIDPANLFFTEILQAAGVHTAAFVSHSYLAPHSGMDQGFDLFDGSAWKGRTVYGEETANRVADRTIAHLATIPPGQRFFVWAHLFDAHFPYAVHEGTPSFGDDEAALYDGEVAFADHHLGRILAALDHSPHAGSTMVVVHSDHGEGLGEHGYVRHGVEVFDDIMRVPMVIRVPGAPPGVYRGAAVANIDLAPTVLDAVDLPVPDAMHGVSLLPMARGDLARPHPPVLGEMPLDHTHTPRKIWIDWPYKLHRAEWLHYELLFDLSVDPGETHDVLAERPTVARLLSNALTAYLATEVHEHRPREAE